MAAIQIPKSVFGLMITAYSMHFKPVNRLIAAFIVSILIVKQQLNILTRMTRP